MFAECWRCGGAPCRAGDAPHIIERNLKQNYIFVYIIYISCLSVLADRKWNFKFLFLFCFAILSFELMFFSNDFSLGVHVL